MLQNQVDHALVKDLEVLRKFSVFCSSVTGMDRIARTSSFVAKFVKNFYCTRANLEDKALKEQLALLTKKMDSISGNFGSTRRILRWSRTFYVANNLLNTIEQFKKAKTTYTKGKELHDVIFFSFIIASDLNDFIGWFASMGLFADDKYAQKASQLNTKLYFYECMVWLLFYLREAYMYRYRNPAYDHNNKEHKTRAFNLKLSFIKYIIDASCSYNAIDPKFITPRTNCVIGLISSAIACYQSWPK